MTGFRILYAATPAGNAGPPPGAAPAPGVGDANTAPTSAPAQPQPSPADGSNVAPDGTNATAPTDTGETMPDAQPAGAAPNTTQPREGQTSPTPPSG